MANHLTWLQAFTLAAEGGRPVRRDAWARWIYKGPAIWYCWQLDGTGAEVFHPVQNTELTSVDMLAADWTDEAWSTTPIFPPGVCCTPVPPTDVPVPASDASTPSFCFCGETPADAGVTTTTTSTSLSATGTSTGTTATPPAPAPKPGTGSGAPSRFAFRGAGTFGSPLNPPDPIAVGGIFHNTPSGGGGGWWPPIGPKPQTLPSVDNPVVTVTIIPTTDADFFAADSRYLAASHDFDPVSDTSTPIVLPELFFRVSIAGGPAGVHFIHYTVGGGTAPGNDAGFKGFAQDKNGTSISFSPGGTITITATYTVDGVPYVGTATYTFPGWHGWVLPSAFFFPTYAPVDWTNAGPGPGGTTICAILLTRLTNGATTVTDVHALHLSSDAGAVTAEPTPGSGPANPLSASPSESVTIRVNVPTATPIAPFVVTLTYDYPGRTITAQMHVASDLHFTGSGQFLPD